MPAKEPASTPFTFHYGSEPTPTLIVTAEMIEPERAVHNMVDWGNPDTLLSHGWASENINDGPKAMNVEPTSKLVRTLRNLRTARKFFHFFFRSAA
jgi:hypothetical protein